MPGARPRPLGGPEAVQDSENEQFLDTDPGAGIAGEVELEYLRRREEAVLVDVEADVGIPVGEVAKDGRGFPFQSA